MTSLGGERLPYPNWSVTTDIGSAAQLHERSARRVAAGGPGRRVVVMEVTQRAVVLGSAQPETTVDRDAATAMGLEVAQRRSGGGAVLVGAGEVLWVDVVLPTGDPLWDHDVNRAAWWVGEWWASALRTIVTGDVKVWRGAMVSSEWSALVCFAGRGPGEVFVEGRKVVGVAQRRTRQGALFQCAGLLRWDPADLLGALELTEAERDRAARELGPVAAGIGAEVGGGGHVRAALLGGLERVGPVRP